jgi:hypothetical protein
MKKKIKQKKSKLVIGASLRTAIIPILKFKFALPLIQQNCNLSITDLLINDIILISFKNNKMKKKIKQKKKKKLKTTQKLGMQNISI